MRRVTAAVAMPVIDRASSSRRAAKFSTTDIIRTKDVSAHASIERLLSEEIAPRLLRLHDYVAAEVPSVTLLIEAFAPDDADISGLADIVLDPDMEAAVAYVIVLRNRGLALETLFVELLEPAARRLGAMWDSDQCSFIDVTLGVARLQRLLTVFNETHNLPEAASMRHVLMAMTPGDQHSFGVTMVERFLSAAGWQVRAEIAASGDEIVETARSNRFAVIGLTAGSTAQLGTLCDLIPRLRAASLYDRVGIMVGGPPFTANPELAQDVGADATACNAPAAVLVAQRLFDLGVAGSSRPPA